MDLVKKNFQLVSCKWNFNNIKELFKHLKNIEDVKKWTRILKKKKITHHMHSLCNRELLPWNAILSNIPWDRNVKKKFSFIVKKKKDFFRSLASKLKKCENIFNTWGTGTENYVNFSRKYIPEIDAETWLLFKLFFFSCYSRASRNISLWIR